MSKIVLALPNDTAVDLTGKEMQPVKFGTVGVALCTAVTDEVIGVVVKGGTDTSSIGIQGEFPVIAAGTITGGGKKISCASGGFQDTAGTAQECGLGIQPAIAGDVVVAYFQLPLKKQA